jgi:hypothetical protein
MPAAPRARSSLTVGAYFERMGGYMSFPAEREPAAAAV